MPALTLEQLVESVQELPPLSQTAMKVLKMTEDASTSARDIGATIAADLALTTQLLKIANSAYYGMPRRISTVSDAVIILGMRALCSLAIAAAASDTLKQEMKGYQLAAGELWRHSIACAIGSQMIAKRTGATNQEEAFVAGLLHDVGKVVLNIHVEHQFQSILALSELDNIPFHEAEKSVLGYDHAEVGKHIGEKWNLPASLCSAIAGHHCLERGADSPKLTAIVHLANGLCLTEGLDISPNLVCPPVDPAAPALLKLSADDLEPIRQEILLEVHLAAERFNMAEPQRKTA